MSNGVNNAEGILPLSTISLINSIEWRSAFSEDTFFSPKNQMKSVVQRNDGKKKNTNGKQT